MIFVSPSLRKLIDTIAKNGGRSILVGGCVRDALLGLPAKDFDIEVYGLTSQELESHLVDIGTVHAVGRAFGVLKVTIKTNDMTETFDVSLPRKENKEGRGHRGFQVTPDPNLTFEKAALRRDFTINAMGYDPIAQKLLDPHQGQKDLHDRILRHVSPAFSEDPLRVLRAAQFKARFAMNIAPETLELCRQLKDELETLPKERIYWEIEKLLLRSKQPACGFRFLQACDALSIFPELEKLIDCPQEPEWHPEGDVWYHTLLVLDEAARLCQESTEDEETKLIILLSALCHDLAKPAKTIFDDGRIRSPGHESGGAKPTQKLLERMGIPQRIIDVVIALVKEHLKPYQLYAVREQVSDAALKRLTLRAPVKELCMLAKADSYGRTTPDALERDDPATHWLWNEIQRLNLEKEPPRPLLQGRHLIALGLHPGAHFKNLLNKAFQAQLENEFKDEDSALDWAKSNLIE